MVRLSDFPMYGGYLLNYCSLRGHRMLENAILINAFEEIILNEETNLRALDRVCIERLTPLFKKLEKKSSLFSFFSHENRADRFLNEIEKATNLIRLELREFRGYADMNKRTMSNILDRHFAVTDEEYAELPKNLEKYMASAIKIADAIEIVNRNFTALDAPENFALLSEKQQQCIRVAQGYLTQDEAYKLQYGAPEASLSLTPDFAQKIDPNQKLTHAAHPLLANLLSPPFQRVARVPMPYKELLKILEKDNSLPKAQRDKLIALTIKLHAIATHYTQMYNEKRDVTLPESVDLNIRPYLPTYSEAPVVEIEEDQENLDPKEAKRAIGSKYGK